MYNTIIIGQGPAGLTAAIYLARAGMKPLLLSSPAEMGQLEQTTEVENFPGFPDGIMGPELIQRMKTQAERFGAEFRTAHVDSVSTASPFEVKTDADTLHCRSILYATGAKPRTLGLESEKEFWGRGVTACAVCDGFFYRDMDVAVIGGGDSACEEALFLTKFARKVYMVHRRDSLRASKIMAAKVLAHEKITVLWNRTVEKVQGTEADGVTELLLKDTQAGDTESLPVSGMFLAVGHIPNTNAIPEEVEKDSKGFIVLKKRTMTSCKGIFAAGDIHDQYYRQAITSAGFGCQAALDIERYLESGEEH